MKKNSKRQIFLQHISQIYDSLFIFAYVYKRYYNSEFIIYYKMS